MEENLEKVGLNKCRFLSTVKSAIIQKYLIMEPPEKWSQNICQLNISDIIKHWHPSLSHQKLIFGGLFGGSLGGWHPQTMSKYLFVKYLLISKQTGTQVELFKKLIFGGPRGDGTPKLCHNICLLNIY